MALDESRIRELAQDIQRAHETRDVLRPFTITEPGITLEDGYSIQSAWINLKLSQGIKIVGRKIGLTSKAMRASTVVDEPDYGIVLDDTLFENEAQIPAGRFRAPRIEIELAFILKSDLGGPNCRIFDVLRATEYIVPAIEILNSRVEKVDPVTQKKRTIVDSISDNAGYGGLIIGGRPFLPTDDVDLRWIGGACYRNGQIEETGLSSGVLGHPALAVAWLANKIAAFGDVLKAGEVVLSGSFIRPVFGLPGDTFLADFGRFGSVSCHFLPNSERRNS